MKIAHEAPKSIFTEVQGYTDYDYALVHLFEEDKEYYNLFKQSVEEGNEVLLDNSIFELGTSFDGDTYYKWINELNPTWYIIPDVLEDKDATLRKMDEWQTKYKISNVSTIGVVQGKSYKELVECYKEIVSRVDKIAISFDYSFFDLDPSYNKYYNYMMGRIKTIHRMNCDGIINTNKPHHLLGCGLPQEFKAYTGLKWIDSVDTSNPIVHGINNIRYDDTGLSVKVPTKLIEYMNSGITLEQLSDIRYNMLMFRSFTE